MPCATTPPNQSDRGAPSDPGLAALAVRALTLLGAEIAFVGLFAYFIYETWQASLTPPNFNSVQETAGAALAVALGAGFALFLGVEPRDRARLDQAGASLGDRIRTFGSYLFKIRPILVLGALAYFLVCGAVCVTYAFNEAVTPGVLKTVAVAFGGYVVAYIGTAFRQYFPA